MREVVVTNGSWLKKWWDIPDDVKEVELVFTVRASPTSYRFNMVPFKIEKSNGRTELVTNVPDVIYKAFYEAACSGLWAVRCEFEA